MKNLQLDFVQRIKLTDLLSHQEGPLGKTAPFLRVMEKARFSDAEAKEIVHLPVETPKGTLMHFQAPAGQPDFGKKKLQLEDSDAEKLKDLLESWERFSTLDHEWADPVVKQLGKEK